MMRLLRAVAPVLTLILLPVAACLTVQSAGAAALSKTHGHTVKYSRLIIFGASDGTCLAGFADDRTLDASDKDACVDAVFSRWQGYHKGRVTLTAPSGRTSVASFGGTKKRSYFHDFPLRLAEPNRLWTVTVRVDGKDVGQGTFSVAASPSPTPLPTIRPVSTPATARPTAEPIVPTLFDPRSLRLANSVFSPASIAPQQDFVADNDAVVQALSLIHSAGYDPGRLTGYFQIAQLQAPGASGNAVYEYLASAYTSVQAATRAYNDGFTGAGHVVGIQPVDYCPNDPCGLMMSFSSSQGTHMYWSAHYGYCVGETYDVIPAQIGSTLQVDDVVGQIRDAVLAKLKSVCSGTAPSGVGQPTSVPTGEPATPVPSPTNTPYVPATPYPTWAPEPAPSPTPPTSGGGGPPPCRTEPDNDNDDQGLPAGSNDKDLTCHLVSHVAGEWVTMVTTLDPWYLYDIPEDVSGSLPPAIGEPIRAILRPLGPVAHFIER